MGEGTSFMMGIAGIFASFIMVLMGFLPAYILFGTLVIAGVLYGTQFFATGIIGGFAAGVFTALGVLPTYAYFTPIVLAILFLAARVADMYVNTGVSK